MLRLGVGKGREVESLRKGEREREEEEGVQHYSVSTYVCCHFIHSEIHSWRTHAKSLAALNCTDCILWLCTQPNPEPSHMAVLTVYCDLCT